MERWILFLTLILPILVWFVVRPLWIGFRRNRIARQPFPQNWQHILERDWPIYQRLPKELKHKLHQAVLVFLAEKKFEGKKGLEITDEIKVLTAAQACLLICNRKSRYYPKLQTVLMYPSTFFSKQTRSQEGASHESNVYRHGESWVNGPLVLSWDASRKGAANPNDGHNVVMHEFAHQLDQEDHRSDGVPNYQFQGNYSAWAPVMGRAYQNLVQAKKKRQKTVLDKYGATHPAEFFAVATESFFEKPLQLWKHQPELYKLLAGFFAMDPKGWGEKPGSE